MEQYLLVQRLGLGYKVGYRRRDVTAGYRGDRSKFRWHQQLLGWQM